MTGLGSDWLFGSLLEDLFALAILVEPSLLDWRQREGDSTNQRVVDLCPGGAERVCPQCRYLVSGVALETQAGDGGFVCHRDLGGGAGVPQVIVIYLPQGGAHHQTSTVQSEIY